MKTILLLLTISLSSFGQSKTGNPINLLPTVNGLIIYSDTINVDSVSRKELYTRAKKWAVMTYKSAKDVIQLDDQSEGILVVKGLIPIQWQSSVLLTVPIDIAHTLTIEMKDGRYRYEMDSFMWQSTTPLEKLGKLRPENARKFYPKFDARVREIMDSLETAMKTRKSDW